MATTTSGTPVRVDGNHQMHHVPRECAVVVNGDYNCITHDEANAQITVHGNYNVVLCGPEELHTLAPQVRDYVRTQDGGFTLNTTSLECVREMLKSGDVDIGTMLNHMVPAKDLRCETTVRGQGNMVIRLVQRKET